MSSHPFCIVIHGGCDTRLPATFNDHEVQAQRAALVAALRVGGAILAAGGSSLDAVERTVGALEDCAMFDAGRGAYRNSDGDVDLDAAIMDGRTGLAGAVAHIHRVRNPIRLARAIMDRTSHVLLVGGGAEKFALNNGLEMVEESYFSPAKGGGLGELDETAGAVGTVGAVALDRAGNLAAGTSTGGVRRRHAGRVGDSPIIGAGTYADNATAAISATGEGEYFLRAVLAHDIAARLAYGGGLLAEAAAAGLRERVTAKGGRGGLIALGRDGKPAIVFNTPTMARGRVMEGGGAEVALFDEPFTQTAL